MVKQQIKKSVRPERNDTSCREVERVRADKKSPTQKKREHVKSHQITFLPIILLLAASSLAATGEIHFNDGDHAAGLTMIRRGFTLAPRARVTFDLAVPTNGKMLFGNESVLALEGDHACASNTTLSIGAADGDRATLFGGAAADHHTLEFGGDVHLPSRRTLAVDGVTDITIDGRGHTVTFDDDSQLQIAAGRTLTLRNVVIDGLCSASNIQGPGKLILHNVVINLKPEIFWQCDVSLEIKGLVVVRGGGRLAQTSNATLRVASFSTLHAEPGTALDEDMMSRCMTYDETARFSAITPAMGTRIISANTFVYGTGDFPYATGGGANQFRNDTVANLATDVATWASTVEKFIITNSNAMLFCCRNNSNAIINLTTAVQNIQQELNTIDHGPNNIHFNDTDVRYSLSYDLFISASHILDLVGSNIINGAGHTIKLAKNNDNIVRIAANQKVIFTNLVIKDFDEGAFQFGANSQLIFGDNTCIELSSMQSLSLAWTVSGRVVFNGFGNVLMMQPGGALQVVTRGALTMQDISITGLKENNIRCQDRSTSLTFKDAHLHLDHNYNFTANKLIYAGDVLVTGTNTFGYSPTDLTSGVSVNSTLLFDVGTTLSYGPQFNNSDLLNLPNSTARLFLNGATLAPSNVDIRLTKGMLIIDHKTSFSTDAVSRVIFGDGTAAGNLSVQILPAAKIQVLGGNGLVYNNTD